MATHRSRGLRGWLRRWAWIVGAVSVALVGCNEERNAAPGGGNAGSGGGFVGPSTPLPCDVAKVLADNCSLCHGRPTAFTAPMSIVSWEDMLRPITWDNPSRPGPIEPGTAVGTEIANRIHHPTNPMPPAQVANRLDPNEMAILNAWLANPQPGFVGQDCNVQSQGGSGGFGGFAGSAAGVGGIGGDAGSGGIGGVGGNAGSGGTAGEGGVGGTGGNAGSGGTGSVVDDPDAPFVGVPPDCETMHEFVAHGQQVPNDPTGYVVSPSTGNSYQCFRFKVPWAGQQRQLVYSEPIIGDGRVLHHWILYAHDSANFSDGQRDTCAGAEFGRYFVQGWAPGGEETQLPRNVGLQLPSANSSFFTLEVHYNNAAGHQGVSDRSGVRICTTSTFRQHTAAVHWLGTEAISIPARGTASPSGSCRPVGQATILGVSPHMHMLGTHMSTIITRANGTTETLHDGAFQFDNQIAYPVRPSVVVGPGDVLRTTCTFTNPNNRTVSFGSATEDEMCYNFVTAYPVGALIQGLNLGANRCM